MKYYIFFSKKFQKSKPFLGNLVKHEFFQIFYFTFLWVYNWLILLRLYKPVTIVVVVDIVLTPGTYPTIQPPTTQLELKSCLEAPIQKKQTLIQFSGGCAQFRKKYMKSLEEP